ncbi:tape measure protein [Variovorax ureilyticus]|uniref:Tape measure protein n=1 Tax=Variovorax ureilyticus TaxID=1836198 RepID=A0ABU8VCW4_9BURK
MASSNNRDVKLKLGVQTDASELTALTAELEKTIATTKQLGKAADAAAIEAATEKRALDDKREALARMRLTTSDADKATDAYRATVKAEQLAILDARTALRDKNAALAAANAAVQKSAAYEKELADKVRATTAEHAKMGETARTVTGDLAGIGQQLRTIQQLAGAAIGGQLLGGMVGDVAKTADAYANLSARIKLTTGDGEAFKATLQGVFDVAQRTGTSVEIVSDLFNKLAAAGKQIGISNKQALALTETITQAVQLSGVSADSASAAIVQLVQGMQSGVLRGDELNSVLEQTPRLAKALADGLGVTTGELRKLGEAGSLTSTQVIGALQGQGAALRAEFDQLPQTIGRSITNLSSAWTQYVGEVDKAHGASATIASAINSLAKNLDTVATVLYDVGKAAVAFQAVRLAQTFTGIGVAAKVATAETAAFTAAQTAANAATGGTAAGVGRLAGILGTLKLGALVGVAVNIKDIGTAIGEQFGKWSKWGDVMRDAEGRMRAQEAAARALAETNAALAQKAQIAADKALGLGAEATALVGAFDKARLAGETTADALGKVAKALDLSNVQGINAAIAALDALAVRGKITGDQMRDALSAALRTEDLGKFRTEAAAAFDGSEIGARRLAAAIDAMGEESLRRAGLSAQELRTGFGAAFASSINDADTLAATLDRLKAKGPETGVALARALDKATDAAGTEKALRAVIERFEALGAAGRLSGDQVATGLEKAREKIESLLPGVSNLREALHDFGIKSSDEMQATASRFADSWKIIRDSVTTSLDDKIVAFEKYAAAAAAANRGIETSEISLQREMLRTRQVAARGTTPTNGTPLQPDNRTTGDNTPRHDGRFQLSDGRNLDGSYRNNADSLGIIGPNQDVHSTINQGLDLSKGLNTLPIDKAMDVLQRGMQSFGASDLAYLQEALQQAKNAKQQLDAMEKLSAGSVSVGALRDAAAMVTATTNAVDKAKRLDAAAKNAGGNTTHNVNITLPNGQSDSIGAASAGDASRLAGLLSQLGQAKRVS